MKGKIQRILTAAWLAVMAGGRLLYLFLGKLALADPQGYYTQAMVQEGEAEGTLLLGPAYIYVKCLSVWLRFTGNHPEAVTVLQVIFQILWLALLWAALRLLFGKTAGLVIAAVISFLPWVWNTVFTASPLNLCLVLGALLLLLVGARIQEMRSEKEGLTGEDTEKIPAAENSGTDEADKPDPVTWQAVEPEPAAKEQPVQIELKLEEPETEEVKTAETEPITEPVIEAVKAAEAAPAVEEAAKVAEAAPAVEEAAKAAEAAPAVEEAKAAEPAEKKPVKYFDNPLPVPKKHVRKEMEFKRNIRKDDFDFNISDDDDFDLK